MSVTDVISIVGIVVPVIVAILGAVWYLSARIEKIKITNDFMAQTIKDHSVEDSRRFNELFTTMRELATQHFRLSDQNFWIAARNGHDQTPPHG